MFNNSGLTEKSIAMFSHRNSKFKMRKENQTFRGNIARGPVILNQKSARHNQRNSKSKDTGSEASLLCCDPVLLGLKIQNGGQSKDVTSRDRSFLNGIFKLWSAIAVDFRGTKVSSESRYFFPVDLASDFYQ